MRVFAVEGLPEVVAGADIATLVGAVDLLDDDVLVVTSKVVAKAEGLVTDRPVAELLAEQTDRQVAMAGPTPIVRTRHGLVLAMAGIDASNVEPGRLVPLPTDPDAAAAHIRSRVREVHGRRVAVVVSDTMGRPWRLGQTDVAIGCAGLVPLDDFAGQVDSWGNSLRVTAPAIADELAGAAELVSGKLGRCPVVVARDLPSRWFTDDDGPGARALVRPEDSDAFGWGAREAVLAAAQRSTRRGFPAADDDALRVLDNVASRSVVKVSRRGEEVTVDGSDPVEAGAVRERLLAVAHAYGVSVRVVVGTVGPEHASDRSRTQGPHAP